MNKAKFHLCLICLIAIGTMVQCQSKLQEMSFLLGTWKVENKESYESWEMVKNQDMKGYNYKIKAGEKVISENLLIKMKNGLIVYEATVLNQNDGQTIPFTLNTNDSEWVSFENSMHDFPKKIQYMKLSKDTLQVQVLGERDQGVSYKLVRQKD